jgi:hypothetical protein
VVVEVRRAPTAWDHDDGCEVAQLRGERLVEHGFVTVLAVRALSAHAIDDGLVGAIGARDVERVHAGMTGQVPSLSRTAVDDAEHARADERGKGRRLDLVQVRHHRVHLEDHDLELHEQLVEHVQRAD